MVHNYKKQKDSMLYRIVNFATIAAPLKLEGEAAYAASNFAKMPTAMILIVMKTC